MRAGIAFLIAAYMLSQFYRAFLAVLAPALQADIGATTGDLARASGLWFAAFALMQLPVGWALDHLGPRRTASTLFLFGGAGGATLFATAQSPTMLSTATILIGIGCAPILMSTYYIFARAYSAAVFGTLAGVTVGLSSLGNILAAAPLAALIEAFGCDALVVALGLDAHVNDPFQGLAVTTAGFARITGAIAGLGLPTLFVQEGGYLSDDLGPNLTSALAGFSA